MLTYALLSVGTGAMFGLAALAIVSIHRASGVVNFAIGAVGVTGAYVYWQLHDVHGWGWTVSLGAGVLSSAALSLVSYYVAMRRLRERSNLAKVVATLAILIIIQATLTLLYPETSEPVRLQPLFRSHGVDIFGVAASTDRLWLLLCGVVLTTLAWMVYRFTRFGLATAAVADSALGLGTLGWNQDRIAAANWAVGGALAGFAAILTATVTQLSVTSTTYFLLPALAAAVIGSLRSFPLAFAGGVLVALIQIEVAQYVDVPGLSDAVPFGVIVAMLTLRGHRIPLRSFASERLPRVSSGRIRWIPITVGFAAATALLMSNSLSVVWLGAVTTAIVTAVVLASLVVVTGFAGQVSLAQWILAGLGALIAVRLNNAGLPFLLSIVCAVFVMGPVGALLALPASRIRGMSFAIVTLGFGVAVSGLVLGNPTFVGTIGAGLAIDTPSVFGLDLNPVLYPERYAVFALAVLVLILVAIANIRRGRAGRRLLAMRANERAAAAIGIDVRQAKIAAFVYATVIATLGGILAVFQFSVATFSSFVDPTTSVQYVGWAVLAGVGYVTGPLVGSLLPAGSIASQAVEDLFPGHGTWVVLFGGILLLATVVMHPDGLVSANVDAAKALRRRVGRGRAGEGTPAVPPAALDLGRSGRVLRRRPAQELHVRDASVVLSGIRAVDAVSVTLRPGEVVGVIGPNGAGKTTLIDAITGFVPLDSGDITLGGRSLRHVAAANRAQSGLARSFQSLELFEDLSVRENLLAASDRQEAMAWLKSVVRPDLAQLNVETTEIVEKLRLGPELDRMPSELPHGRRRLVSIARAVANEPSILLLDEPAAGLDDADRETLVDIIKILARDYNVGVLLVEHDVRLVADAADRILCLDMGRQIAYGEPEEVLATPAVVEAYLGAPHEPAAPAAKLRVPSGDGQK
jgi:sulfate-transporting ATPase